MPPRARIRKRDPVLPEARSVTDPDLAVALLAEQITLETLRNLRAMPYERYCSEVLGMELSEGQRVICRTIFDGKAPSGSLAKSFFGEQPFEPTPFSLRTVATICGRGSGKSRVFLAARALHLALVVDLSAMSPNDPPALVAIIAPDMRQAKQTLGFIKAFLDDRPLLKKVLGAECLQEVVRIKRPDGRRVNIEARPATAGGNSIRGPVLAGVLLEESAFFESDGYEVNDKEIYRSARPRVLLVPGAQIVLASTPWSQEGLLWDLYRDNFGKPDSAVVCRAPTLLVRANDDTKKAYEIELKTDPDNARREYDAEFLSADSERFFPENLITNCIDGDLSPPLDVGHGESVRFGGDFAFASDSSALVGFVERGGVFHCCEVDELRPTASMPLVPSRVVARFGERMAACGAKLLVADDHYREAIQEHLTKFGIALTSVGNTPAHAYVLTRTLMAQGRVRIPNNPRLLNQLRRVRSTVKPGGVVTIHQPRAKEGGHGDLVSALVCALSGVTVTSTFAQPKPMGVEALRKQAAEEQAARLKANEDRLNKQNRGMLLALRRKIGSRMLRALTK